MALFFVAYDLDKPAQNYQNLWDELESLGAIRIQDSVWALKFDGTPRNLYDTISRHISTKIDRLLVVKNGGSTFINLMTNPNDL